MQLPLAWLVFERWWRREPLDAAERCALALGLFGVLQAAAIAYSRGAVLPESRPLSRYQDPLLLGAAGQLFAVLKILVRPGSAGRVGGLLWGGVALGGLIGLTTTNFTLHLPFKRTQDRANLAIVRAYAVSGDSSVFTRDPNFSGPHPDPRVVRRVIDDPALRATLPAEVLAPDGNQTATYPRIIRESPLLTAASATVFLFLLALRWRPTSDRTHSPVPAQPGTR